MNIKILSLNSFKAYKTCYFNNTNKKVYLQNIFLSLCNLYSTSNKKNLSLLKSLNLLVPCFFHVQVLRNLLLIFFSYPLGSYELQQTPFFILILITFFFLLIFFFLIICFHYSSLYVNIFNTQKQNIFIT